MKKRRAKQRSFSFRKSISCLFLIFCGKIFIFLNVPSPSARPILWYFRILFDVFHFVHSIFIFIPFFPTCFSHVCTWFSLSSSFVTSVETSIHLPSIYFTYFSVFLSFGLRIILLTRYSLSHVSFAELLCVPIRHFQTIFPSRNFHAAFDVRCSTQWPVSTVLWKEEYDSVTNNRLLAPLIINMVMLKFWSSSEEACTFAAFINWTRSFEGKRRRT